MARRKSTRGSKIQPAVQTLTFATGSPGVGNTETSYIDLSQVASLVNRRFYRQGINWAVAGFKVTSLQPGTVSVSKLQNTWVTSNAWEKAFRMWNKQQMEAVEDGGAESAVAKFRDFKVHMDTAHVANGFANNLLPVTIDGATILPGEWDPSLIVLPNTASDGTSLIEPSERLLHMNGLNVNGIVSRGIIEGYADSRAYPQSPDPVSPDIASSQNWMARMFDVGNDINESLENATDRNDDLPYDQVNYPGGSLNFGGLEWHDFTQIYSNSGVPGAGVGIQRLKGGNFPCGLIRIDWTPDVENANLIIQVNLIPGNHRGYLCEPMTEM